LERVTVKCPFPLFQGKEKGNDTRCSFWDQAWNSGLKKLVHARKCTNIEWGKKGVPTCRKRSLPLLRSERKTQKCQFLVEIVQEGNDFSTGGKGEPGCLLWNGEKERGRKRALLTFGEESEPPKGGLAAFPVEKKKRASG